MENKRSSFSGQLGFIIAAAASAVGLGNIWRFPYLAAGDEGGIFIFVYIILTLTFGFTLLTTEIAIGRKTKQSPLTAYKKLHKGYGFIGLLACIVPTIILPYYCSIGGWVFKYLSLYVTNKSHIAVDSQYFNSYIGGTWQPIIWMLVYFGITAFIVISGVEKGIEKFSKVLMPILVVMIIGISVFSLTLKHEGIDAEGNTFVRTGIQGLKVYIVPNFKNVTPQFMLKVIMDAMGQLFFSISVAMGIMVAYGSYAKDDTNLIKSINQIEIFDTAIALLAGLMIVPAVYTFRGMEGMDGGPGLIFKSLPIVFDAMGVAGKFIGALFFIIVSFAAVTSSVSVMEAIVSSLMDALHLSRIKSSIIVTVYTLVTGVLVCLGYNKLLFTLNLPNGSEAQLLDVMDYISNYIIMPLVAFSESILVGWVIKPDMIIAEITGGKLKFSRKGLYVVMIKFIVPVLLLILLLNSFGLVNKFIEFLNTFGK